LDAKLRLKLVKNEIQQLNIGFIICEIEHVMGTTFSRRLTVPHLCLTTAQRDALNQLEQKSFRDYCSRMGYDPNQHERHLLQAMKDKTRHLLATGREQNLPGSSDLDAVVRQDLEEINWWQYKRRQIKTDVETAASDLADCAHVVPIDWGYLERLASRIGLKPPNQSVPATLAAFLNEIPPHSSLWQ
jgi:hypothetical protein